MRLLIALLISLNLALLSWALLRPEYSPPRPPPLPDGPGLVLLSEVERLPGPPAYAEIDAVLEPESAAPECLALGPFQTPADLRQVAGVLQAHVGRLQPREARSTELRGYRVFLPALPSREAALAAARDLAAQGMRDYYVVTAGPEENAVSLGMFRDLDNAENRRDEVRALGHPARLEPRTDEVAQWFLDIAVAAGTGQDWRLHLDEDDGEWIEATPIPCF